MELPITAACGMTEARDQTMPGMRFFYLGAEATMETMWTRMDELIEGVSAARNEGGITSAGPLILRYLMHEPDDGTFTMQAGFAVGDEVVSVAGARLEQFPPFRCVSTVFCGALQNLGTALDQVQHAATAAGLKATADYREWYLYFEGENSPNNVTLVQQGVEE